MPENTSKERREKSSDQSRSQPVRSRKDMERVNTEAQSQGNQDGFLFIDDDDYEYDADPRQHSMENLQYLRQKIRDGSMERVAPGSRSSREIAGPAPPRPSQNSYRGPVTSQPKTQGRERKKSITSKWAESFKVGADTLVGSLESGADITKSLTGRRAESIGAGADASNKNPRETGANSRGKAFGAGLNTLEEKRKGLQAKFRAEYEQLRFPRFSGRRRGSDDSVNSVETFFCQGELADLQVSQPKQENIKQEQGSVPGNLGREHVETQTHTASAQCRLSTNPGAQGIHGFCIACEDEFLRRQRITRSIEREKPVPRPKDQKWLPAERLSRNHSQGKHVANQVRRKELDFQAKEERQTGMRLGVVGRKPVIHTPDPRRPRSQAALVEGGDDSASEYDQLVGEEEWQMQKQDIYRGFERKDSRQSLPGEEPAARNRATGFYGYWDDLITDDQDNRLKQMR